jgi:hypothetical protein
MGLLSLQSIRSAVRQLTSGVSSAQHNDKYCLGASTGLEAMKRFCHLILAVYGDNKPSVVTQMLLISDNSSTWGVLLAFLVA